MRHITRPLPPHQRHREPWARLSASPRPLARLVHLAPCPLPHAGGVPLACRMTLAAKSCCRHVAWRSLREPAAGARVRVCTARPCVESRLFHAHACPRPLVASSPSMHSAQCPLWHAWVRRLAVTSTCPRRSYVVVSSPDPRRPGHPMPFTSTAILSHLVCDRRRPISSNQAYRLAAHSASLCSTTVFCVARSPPAPTVRPPIRWSLQDPPASKTGGTMPQ